MRRVWDGDVTLGSRNLTKESTSSFCCAIYTTTSSASTSSSQKKVRVRNSRKHANGFEAPTSHANARICAFFLLRNFYYIFHRTVSSYISRHAASSTSPTQLFVKRTSFPFSNIGHVSYSCAALLPPILYLSLSLSLVRRGKPRELRCGNHRFSRKTRCKPLRGLSADSSLEWADRSRVTLRQL